MTETARLALAAVLPAWLTDVVVKIAPVAPTLAGQTDSGVLWRAAPGRFLLDVPDVARYLVADSRSITVDPRPDAAVADVVRFTRATALAALCYQRGMAVFHAAAASWCGQVVMLAGDSSVGKSTLLAALLTRGWTLLADDLAAVELNESGHPVVLPTCAEVILWPDAVNRLGIDTRCALDTLERSANDAAATEGPRSFVAGDRFLNAPRRLRAIWWLSTHNVPQLEVRHVLGLDRFDALGKLAYNSRVAYALLDRVAYLRIAGAMADSVPLRRLLRPRGHWTLEDMADLVDEAKHQESS